MCNLASVFVELECSEIPGADRTFQSFQQLGALSLDDLNPDHCAPCSRQQHLAGPLGFEPRQSAPKALDLPLVDGPVVTRLRLREILRCVQDFGGGLPLALALAPARQTPQLTIRPRPSFPIADLAISDCRLKGSSPATNHQSAL
jgi:hypothetical protein